LRFHGCPESPCSSAQPIRPLRPPEEPTTWADLRALTLGSGFVEIRMSCRGGTSQPPPGGLRSVLTKSGPARPDNPIAVLPPPP
jgi:hypothetical protein